MGMVDAAERSITKGMSLTRDPAARKNLNDLRDKAAQVRIRLEVDGATSAFEADVLALAQAKAKLCFTHLLSPDVILLIAEAGLQSDPDMPLRMAGVCTEWRAIVTHRTAVWSHLRLGRRRPEAKVAYWVEKSKSRVRQLTITNKMPRERHTDVARMLRRHVAGLERLEIHAHDPDLLVNEWQEACRQLKSLVIHNVRGSTAARRTYPFVFGLLHPTAARLEAVDIGCANMAPGTVIQGDDPDANPRDGLWLPNPTLQLACLRKLRIADGLAGKRMTLSTLLADTPHLHELDVGRIFFHAPEEDDTHALVPRLEKLELRDTGGQRDLVTALDIPGLTAFSCYGWTTGQLRTIDMLRGVGMAAALPNLVSLDIGRCGVIQSQLMAVLPELKSLRFLNVSFLGLNNDFLEALVVGDTALLPCLTALSMAGHDNISAGPLRRVVLSRAPTEASKAIAPLPTRPASRSAFTPARSAFARPKPAAVAVAATATSSSPQRPPVAAITWVCVDLCNHPDMDVRVLEPLRRRVRFLSNHNGNQVEDRIRGRGIYAWDKDGDWDSDCAGGSGEGCHLRKRRADEDGWYVHHTCKRAREEEQVGK